MGVPLCQAKSTLFRALGHPVRICVPDLLDGGPKTVRQLSDAIAIGASRLSQRLAVLRGTGLVLARRDGNTVEYSLSAREVTHLVRTARHVLTHLTLGSGGCWRNDAWSTPRDSEQSRGRGGQRWQHPWPTTTPWQNRCCASIPR